MRLPNACREVSQIADFSVTSFFADTHIMSLTTQPLSISIKTCLWLIILACVPGLTAEEVNLRVRIDQLVDAERVGPPSTICSDSEFLRRAYLDLLGKIPSAAEARAFLADNTSEKRALLVDSLLENSHFDRNFMRVLDVMLMERKPEKVVSPGQFRAFLRRSIESGKGLDELIRDILIADGAKKEQRPAARFLLDRAAEPHVITRDVGRIFLGVDMQCAQCHDHPSIDDYLQADYYGLYAFLNRSYLYGTEKEGVVAERAEGEASFVSVFEGGDPQEMLPHLPGEQILNEPKMAQDQRYHVKPAEGVRPIPKFSRRALLAEELTSGKYTAFQRNLANRIWAHMFGRGIVHPLDLHHSGNPPVHPELLDALGEGLASLKFDLRNFVREIALSQTYQRSSEIPEQLLDYAHRAHEDRKPVEAARSKHQKAAEKSAVQQKAVQASIAGLQGLIDGLGVKRESLHSKTVSSQKAAEVLETQASQYAELVNFLEHSTNTIQELSLKANQIVSLAPQDPLLTEIAERTLRRRSLIAAERTQTDHQLEGIRNRLQVILDTCQKTSSQLADVEQQMHGLEGRQAALLKQSAELQRQLDRQKQLQIATEARLKDFETLQKFADIAKQESQDNETYQEAWQQLASRWRDRFQCGDILPLTAEQLTWSITEALGVVDRQRDALLEEYNKKNKSAPSQPESNSTDFVKDNKKIEYSLHTKVEQSLYDFIVNVHDYRGQPDGNYQATAREALFLSHSQKIQEWIQFGAQKLLERVGTHDKDDSIAQELYLTILSRHPNEEETAIVTGYLKKRSEDQQSAIRDLAWALLNCAEFRFQY